MKVYPRFHVKSLRPYYQRDNIVHSVAPFVSDSEEIEFVPLSIQNVRFHSSGERQFLIVWRNQPAENSTWVFESDLSEYAALIRNFLTQRRTESSGR